MDTMSIYTLMWIFPVVFMLHELEEIIFMKKWIEDNSPSVLDRFPRIGKRIFKTIGGISTASIALAITEEYILLIILTFLSVGLGLYNLFFSILGGYLFHLVIHLLHSLALRKYTPGLILGILSAIPTAHIMNRLFEANYIDLISQLYIFPIVLGVTFINLHFALQLARFFEKQMFSQNKSCYQ